MQHVVSLAVLLCSTVACRPPIVRHGTLPYIIKPASSTTACSHVRASTALRSMNENDEAAAEHDNKTDGGEPLPSLPRQKDLTTVGSQAYYRGFLESPLRDPAPRGSTGDSSGVTEFDVDTAPQDGLEQALKLSGGASVLLGVMLLAFLASNGLINVP